MKYIIAQDENLFSYWQLTVAIQSILDNGVNPEDIYVLFGTYGYNKDAKAFERRFKNVNIIRYRNTIPKNYIAAVKPYLLWKFFEQFPNEVKNQWMLIDNDVMLMGKMGKFKKGKVYLSNTQSYTGYDYIKSKGEDVLNVMLKASGVNEDIVKENDAGSGGAQYIFDNVDAKVWMDAYHMSVSIFVALSKHRHVVQEGQDHIIQIWCSEMWGVLWSFWKNGHKTYIDKRLNFCMSSDTIDTAKNVKILHNSGVTNSGELRLFNKGSFRKKSPKDSNLDINNSYVSSIYYSYVKKTL